MTPTLAIEASQLSKSFRDAAGQRFNALDAVSLQITSGSLTALVGPDGAGKTTLLRLIAGLMRADSGTLRVLDIDVGAAPQQVQNRISYMPQRFGLYEDLSIQENLDLYADLHGVPANERRQRFARLLEMTDLARFTQRLAGKLSDGMKQKLGLACTLVRAPDLLILDEPTVGVDPLSRRELWQIVQQLIQDEQLSVIVSTAYLDEAEQCSHVLMMVEGKILAEGTPEVLRQNTQGLCFSTCPPAGVVPRNLQAYLSNYPTLVADAVPDGDRVRLIRDRQADDAAWRRLTDGLALTSNAPRLEDGFMLLLHELARQKMSDAEPAPFLLKPQVAAENREPVIAVHDLVRRFGDFTAVDRTTFSVAQGEVFGLLGPNGAGKTTTFRMLCGLLPVSDGEIQVAGVNLRQARNEARRRIGYVAQKFALYGNLTVQENLAFFSGVYGLRGRRRRERIEAVVEQFALGDKRYQPAGQLPGGYKQRLAMAAALMHEPQILFLDEPTSGIDPLARRAFWRRITALAAEGVTIVITTHFMEEAEYCDRIVIQDAGKLLALGSPQEIRKEVMASEMNDAFIRIVERARQQSKGVA